MSAGTRALVAMGRANARYWPTVLPQVQHRLRFWDGAARRIPHQRLREIALEKLAEERFNTEVAATLATLAPWRQRPAAIAAIVPLQVMYDYLDGLSEEPAADPLGSSRELFRAFTVALTPERFERADYYSRSSGWDDGGYLQTLVEACRRAFASLPGAAAVAPAARAAALRCGESRAGPTRSRRLAPGSWSSGRRGRPGGPT
jgi:tetraprenyl-beta-curcumene synthase